MYFSYNVILAQSRAIPVDRDDDGWHLVGGDEEKNDKIELEAAKAEVGTIPSKLKAVIKFGYEDGMLSELTEDFDSWIAGVFTHTQAHFRRSASLGTTIEFEVSNVTKLK